MPKVSIIVPVYKAEKYLHRCVDSILSQSFTDWECILVDDGSPDRSGAICDEYAQKDARIRVIHKENGGVSSARNLGLEQAVGEWITFIDADDFISDNYLTAIEYSSKDIIILESKMVNGSEQREFTKLTPCISSNIESYKEIIEKYIRRAIMKVPWGKFIKKECIGQLRFNEGQTIGEDALFMYDLFALCNSIEIMNGFVYYWQEDSIPDYIKYKLTVNTAIEYTKLIYNSYLRLNIKSNDLEQFLVNYFFSLCDKEEYKLLSIWFGDQTIKELERKAFVESYPMDYVFWKRHPYLMLQFTKILNILRMIKQKIFYEK